MELYITLGTFRSSFFVCKLRFWDGVHPEGLPRSEGEFCVREETIVVHAPCLLHSGRTTVQADGVILFFFFFFFFFFFVNQGT